MNFNKLNYIGCDIIMEGNERTLGEIFSKCIPKELIPEIINSGKENFDIKVYRVSKYGTIEKKVFYNSYLEHESENRLSHLKKRYELNDIGTYSTSCHNSIKSPRKYLNLLKQKYSKNYPRPIIIEGYPICGLSQASIERNPDYEDDTHIDWWIYDDDKSFDKIILAFSEKEVH